jgi:hypothetical protein
VDDSEETVDDSDERNEEDNAVAAESTRWAAPSTAKEQAAVQRAVDRLLDAIVPERVVGRYAPVAGCRRGSSGTAPAAGASCRRRRRP